MQTITIIFTACLIFILPHLALSDDFIPIKSVLVESDKEFIPPENEEIKTEEIKSDKKESEKATFSNSEAEQKQDKEIR